MGGQYDSSSSIPSYREYRDGFGDGFSQFNIDTVMPDPDPASPAFIKEMRYRFAYKK